MADSNQQPAETPEPRDQELDDQDLDSVAGGREFYEDPTEDDDPLDTGPGGTEILTPIVLY